MGRSKKSETNLASMLGSEIRACRLRRQWTQEDLAARLGVEVNTVSRMECGTHLPSLQRLASLADVLEVPVGTLLGAASTHPVDQVQRLQALLSGLTEAQREFVVDSVRRQAEFFRTTK